MPLRFMGGPADRDWQLTLIDRAPEAQSPGLLPLSQQQYTGDRPGRGLLDASAAPQSQPDLLDESDGRAQAAQTNLPAEPLYPPVTGGPGDEAAPARITVRPARALQTLAPNGHGRLSTLEELGLVHGAPPPTEDQITRDQHSAWFDPLMRAPNF